MDFEQNERQERPKIIAFVHENGIEELNECMTIGKDDGAFRRGPRIDYFIAFEIAKLKKEEQERIVTAFKYVSERNAALRRKEKRDKEIFEIARPWLEKLQDLLINFVKKFAKRK